MIRALILATVVGLPSVAHASCVPSTWQAMRDSAEAAGIDHETAYQRASDYCEEASIPGTYQWALERAKGCGSVAWAERLPGTDAWLAVCATDSGAPWLVVRP